MAGTNYWIITADREKMIKRYSYYKEITFCKAKAPSHYYFKNKFKLSINQ
jgi:hypothetical protein